MPTAKDIIVKPISAADARRLVRRIHYSGKVVQNSVLHLGVFLDGKCEGAMQFGSSLDKGRMKGLVAGTGWNEFIELNRMAFSDKLPKYSESRAIGIAMRLIRKEYPHIKWVISFADGTQCGDGTIYRASGFVLTAIKVSKNLCRLPDNSVIHKMTLESNPTSSRPELGGKSYYDVTGGKYNFKEYVSYVSGEIINGFQIRYIYFLDKSYREKLTVPEMPFSKIDEMGAGMYKGIKRVTKAISSDQLESGGAIPTNTLQIQNENQQTSKENGCSHG